VQLEARALQPTRVGIFVCDMHLLYPQDCRHGVVVTPPGATRWTHLVLALPEVAEPAARWPPRSSVFGIAVLDAGRSVDIDEVRLEHHGEDLLRNSGFSNGLARWFPSAQRYFVPWHIDSLPLELLIEHGLAGLAAFALLVGCVLRAALSPRNRGLPAMPVLVASLLAALLIGLVSSVLDVPRVAFLFFMLSFLTMQYSQTAACRAGR
jgi:hypothetical protein